jgi:hypothetical protein
LWWVRMRRHQPQLHYRATAGKASDLGAAAAPVDSAQVRLECARSNGRT